MSHVATECSVLYQHSYRQYLYVVIAMSSLVPSIDLSIWTKPTATAEELERIACDWDSAFHSSGLVYLTNHGLGELYHRAAAEWKHFCAMQAEEKDKFSSSV